MLEREACERRVYRLATLLTGDPSAATTVIAQVVDSQPDLSKLDSAHMDRLAVLRSREIEPGMIVAENLPQNLAKALSQLTSQQREAWVLTKVYRMPRRDAAKAMDCSVNAAEQHLNHAEATMGMAASGGGQEAAAKALLEYSMSLDVPGFYRAQRRQRRVTSLVVRLLILAAMLAGLALALAWWLSWVKTEDTRAQWIPPIPQPRLETEPRITAPSRPGEGIVRAERSGDIISVEFAQGIAITFDAVQCSLSSVSEHAPQSTAGSQDRIWNTHATGPPLGASAGAGDPDVVAFVRGAPKFISYSTDDAGVRFQYSVEAAGRIFGVAERIVVTQQAGRRPALRRLFEVRGAEGSTIYVDIHAMHLISSDSVVREPGDLGRVTLDDQGRAAFEMELKW
jgi:hypothetical protein